MKSKDMNFCCAPIKPGTETFHISFKQLPANNINVEHKQKLILAGNFLMGTNDEYLPIDGENPTRVVFISDYFIDQFTVTNRQFAKFSTETAYKTDAETIGWSYVFKPLIDALAAKNITHSVAQQAPWWVAIEGARWNNPTGEEELTVDLFDHPVVHVSWNDASRYSAWAGLRLPTEAEWEKASRGGLQQNEYPWGDNLYMGNQHNTNIWQGNFPTENTKEDGFIVTAPVDSFNPNGYGLFNTVGNVWEWTNDYWSSRWHKNETSETRVNPQGPQKKQGNKVLKGGSFLCHKSYCNRYRNSARTFNSPQTSTNHIGFRCAQNSY